jgi:HlyD family secretion protein
VVLIGGVGIYLKMKAKSKAEPTVVRVEQVLKGQLTEIVSAPGTIEPETKVAISARVSARIVALPFDEGQAVTCGDPNADPPVPPSILVKLDSKDLESQLRSAEASRAAQLAQIEVDKARLASQKDNIVRLEASCRQAQRDLQRQKQLLESQDISQAVFDAAQCKADELAAQYSSTMHEAQAAELNLEVLKHRIEIADAEIARAQDALSYTTITSPINGVVTRVNAEVGEVVVTGTMNNAGTVILEVADLSKMICVAEIDEADVPNLKVGQKAKVRVQAFPDHEFKGVVQSVALRDGSSRQNGYSVSNGAKKYFEAEIAIEPDDAKLFSGFTADVDIQTAKHDDIFKVPSQAVLGVAVDELPSSIRDNSQELDKAKTYATVVYRIIDGKAVATPVKTGPSDMTDTIIVAGIGPEDRIVVGPYKVLANLKHDQAIKEEGQPDAKKSADKSSNKTDANESKHG